MFTYKIVTVLVCFTISVLAKKYTKKIFNPLTVFAGIWSIILFLAGLELYGLKSASASTYVIFCLGVVAYAIGFFLKFRNNNTFVFKKNSNRSSHDFCIRYNIIYIIGCVCVIYFLIQFALTLPTLMSGNGLAAIRVAAQAEDVATSIGGKLINSFRILIIMPFAYAILPITAIDQTFGRKDKKTFFICLAIIILRLISEGGRISIIYFILHILVCFSFIETSLIKERNIRLKRFIKKNKKKFIIGIVVLIFVFIVASFSRSGKKLQQVTYYYFAMQPYMYETWSEKVDDANIIGYGVGSYNGFIFPVLYIIKNIIGIPFTNHFDQVYRIILATDSDWQIITSFANRANAYVGTFWYFYLDGRNVGIIILSLVYGFIGGLLYSKAKRRTNEKTVCLFAFYMQSIILSFSGFAFSSLYYSLAYVFLIFIAFKPKNSEALL